jgi:hypothetical protein
MSNEEGGVRRVQQWSSIWHEEQLDIEIFIAHYVDDMYHVYRFDFLIDFTVDDTGVMQIRTIPRYPRPPQNPSLTLARHYSTTTRLIKHDTPRMKCGAGGAT